MLRKQDTRMSSEVSPVMFNFPTQTLWISRWFEFLETEEIYPMYLSEILQSFERRPRDRAIVRDVAAAIFVF